MGLIAASALVMVGTAQASAELAASSGCMNCHMVDKKMVGPGLKDIAAKYKGDAGAPAKLTEKILKGSNGVWGPIPMPPNAGVSEANAKTLAQFILSLK
jgi:cytochrome c